MTRILIVEDEPDIAAVLADDLRVDGYEVETATDGDAGLLLATTQAWDLILLDLMLPRRDGLDVCQSLRRSRVRTPIIMLTARTQEAEKILGLELGADDYVTKPFSPRELRARIKAVLRRLQPDTEGGVHRFADFEVDFDRAELRRGRKLVDPTVDPRNESAPAIIRQSRPSIRTGKEFCIRKTTLRQFPVTPAKACGPTLTFCQPSAWEYVKFSSDPTDTSAGL